MAVIDVANLTKRYGNHYAVKDLSFTLSKGDIVGFLGPNGAGKTTTLRMLAGFLGSTAGKIVIAGHDIADAPFEVRRSIGYMPETVPLYAEMRVIEYLSFRAAVKRVPRNLRDSYVSEAMEKSEILDVAMTTIGHLSKGYRQRVGLADALVAKPPVLILDEPTAGLDPNQIRSVRSILKGLAADHTVLLSTHMLGEVEASCSRGIVIHRGEMRAQGTIDELRAMRRAAGLDITFRGDAIQARGALELVRGICSVSLSHGGRATDQNSLRCVFGINERAETIAEQAIAALVNDGIGVCDARLGGGSLEDVFLELTRSENDATEGA